MKTLKNLGSIVVLLLTATLILAGNGEKEKSPLTFESLYSFESVRALSLSPDGRQIVLVTSRGDVEKNRSCSSIWLMDTNGKNLRKIGPEGKYLTHVRWVDGGRNLAYLTFMPNRKRQIMMLEIKSGKEKQVTNFPSGISDFEWSPQNCGVVFAAAVYPENPSPEYTIQKEKEEAAKKHGGKLYDSLLFRPYNHWDNGTVNHLFYLDFKTGKVKDLTPGSHHAPTAFLEGRRDIAFSPDGKIIAYTSNTDPVQAISTNNDVFTVTLSGDNRTRVSTSPGSDVNPRFSPNGRYLAYTQMARAQFEADQRDIILVDRHKGSRRNLTQDFDRTLYDLFWSPDSRYIYFISPDKGYNVLVRIDVRNGKLSRILSGLAFQSVHVAENNKDIFLILSRSDRPGEVTHFNVKTGKFTQLTHFSADFITRYDLATTQVFWYQGAQNDQVMGFISFPPKFDKNNKYPMLMLFHGGPEGAWMGGYSNYGWNIHLMAAQGYVIAQINPHGSNSYGLKFQEGIIGNWGSIDVEDVMKGLDFLAKNYPQINMERVAALGRSYGGFLVNYLNGVTDRFRCFVSVDGIFDMSMEYYTTDELWFKEYEFQGTPYERPEAYRKASPMAYAKNFKTPTLVVHGGRDYRVDASQGVAMFTALRRLNIPAKLLFFPDEPHYFRQLQTWKYTYEVQIEWLAHWLKD